MNVIITFNVCPKVEFKKFNMEYFEVSVSTDATTHLLDFIFFISSFSKPVCKWWCNDTSGVVTNLGHFNKWNFYLSIILTGDKIK